MPWYKFTIKLRDGSVHSGIRQLAAVDLDYVWRAYEGKAKDHYKKQLSSFEVIQLSKLSQEIRDFIASQGKRDEWKLTGWTTTPNRKKGYKLDPISLEERKGKS